MKNRLCKVCLGVGGFRPLVMQRKMNSFNRVPKNFHAALPVPYCDACAGTGYKPKDYGVTLKVFMQIPLLNKGQK